MTDYQISELINTFLTLANLEVEKARECSANQFKHDSWIVHMTASTVFGGIADALIAARRHASRDHTDYLPQRFALDNTATEGVLLMPKNKREDQEKGSTGGPGSAGGSRPNQVPEGPLADAIGTHKESDFDKSDTKSDND